MEPPHEFVTRDEFSRFVKDIKGSLTAITEAISDQRKEMHALATTQAATGKLSASTLLGIGAFVLSSIGVVATILTVIGAMALRPLNDSTDLIHANMRADSVREMADARERGALQLENAVVTERVEALIERMTRVENSSAP